jgi:hypothetical protein
MNAEISTGYARIRERSRDEWQEINRERARRDAANRKIRLKSTSKEQIYVHRLGYHSVVSNYTAGNPVNHLSGSSINRRKSKIEKDQKEAVNKTKTDAIDKVKTIPVGRSIPAWVCPGLLSPVEVAAVRNRKRVSRAPGRDADKIHVLNGRSKGIVKSRCTAFYRACPNRKTLCTLTFVGDVTDADAVKVLNKFFTVLRSKFPNLLYIWVAERQMETTNRIHFHCILNVFLPIQKINALWIRQQYNAGVINSRYTVSDIDRATDAELHKMLNPVDVVRVKNIKHLSCYLTKYITKGNNGGGFGCLAWHCSREVSQLFLRTVAGWEVVELAKGMENARFNRKTGEFFGMPQPVREAKGSKFYYTIWYLNQPGRFLPFLKELEEINRYIIGGWVSPDRVIQYLNEANFEDRLN